MSLGYGPSSVITDPEKVVRDSVLNRLTGIEVEEIYLMYGIENHTLFNCRSLKNAPAENLRSFV